MKPEVSIWRENENKIECFDRQGMGKISEWTAEPGCCRTEDGIFKNSSSLKKVVLPGWVKEIGMQSFYNNCALREAKLEAVVFIRKEAFYNCVRLKNIYLPGTVSFIGKRAFAQCRRAEQIVFAPNSRCREIKEEVFSYCINFHEMAVPKAVRRIGRRAFYKCTSLEKIRFPKNLKEIGEEAFYQTALTELELPMGLEKIGASAFLKCNRLEYVRIPESVREIEKWAFHGCNRLKVLEIPGEPEEIGDWIINRAAKIRCRRGTKVEEYCRRFAFEMELME